MKQKYHTSNRRSSLARANASDDLSLFALVGERMRKIRHSKGMSLRMVCERGGPSPDLLGRAESGLVNMAATTMMRAARALGVPVRDFFVFDEGDDAGAWVYALTNEELHKVRTFAITKQNGG